MMCYISMLTGHHHIFQGMFSREKIELDQGTLRPLQAVVFTERNGTGQG